MSKSGKDLGLDRRIPRRDILHGFGATAALAGLGRSSPLLAADQPVAPFDADYYPPALAGLRGNHRGSWEAAHDLALENRQDWGPVQEPEDPYDLVVVGGGISGLSTAYFYLQKRPGSRVLILDNHDDFGGHARRNEFQLDGQTLIGHAGSQAFADPSRWSRETHRLLAELGIEPERFPDYYDSDFYARHGLTFGFFFDEASYGENRYVPLSTQWGHGPVGFRDPQIAPHRAVESFPLAPEARAQLAALYAMEQVEVDRRAAGLSAERLNRMSYLEFARDYLGVDHPEALGVIIPMPEAIETVGFDAQPVRYGSGYGLPVPAAVLQQRPVESFVRHFPDAIATVARQLVAQLFPSAVGSSADLHSGSAAVDDLMTERIDYSQLDRPNRTLKLRLNSTAVNVIHDDVPERSRQVLVTYFTNGRAYRARSGQVVLACYNMMIPHLCPTLPQAQRRAMYRLIKSPLVYTNVVLGNWHAVKAQGFGGAYCPGCMHSMAFVDFPTSVGRYRQPDDSDRPIILHLEWAPTNPGMSKADQNEGGHLRITMTPFREIERSIREQLAGLLGPGGFDPANDIAAMTVNRHPHGYAWTPDPVRGWEGEGPEPHLVARQPFHRIAIANSDAGARFTFDTAIDQAYRAVGELSA
ncbi:MAG: NAD(P)/FAD-dependent oxidoreductase [Rhodospirillaceae bacterium]|nr:NAD(P)/FAD-dependent oxidoreductase [Rhodospirillaceae bacterium]